MSCFILLFNLDYCVYVTSFSWECLSLHFTSFSTGSYLWKAVLCAITVLYTVYLYFPTNIEVQTTVLLKITFILEVNVLFPIALQFRLLSEWNIIQLRMSIFTLHVIFPWFLFRKAVLCVITVLYTVSL